MRGSHVATGAGLFISAEPGPVFAYLHEPTGALSGTAVLLLPPFGFSDVCSYRSRRNWADALASRGIPTVRTDLPGTGDSAGRPRDPQRLEAWTSAAGEIAAWLRQRTGCPRIVAFGIGLGGLVACRAIAQGAAIDDVILWGVPTKGRSLVRELSALARMEASAASAPDPEAEQGALEEGDVAAAGYLMTDATVRALRSLDLTELLRPGRAPSRALLLVREGQRQDPALVECLEQCGTEVTIAPGDGWGTMIVPDPHLSKPAWEVLDSAVAWIEHEPAPADLPEPAAGAVPGAAPAAADSIEMEIEGARFRESVVTFDGPGGQCFGILTEPLAARLSSCAVFLNAGAQRRIGPNRMWTEMARRWARQGLASVRIDLPGIGDAPGDDTLWGPPGSFYTEDASRSIESVLDALVDRGLPARFLTVGLCSGGYWAFHEALGDDRVTAAVLLNPGALVWDPSLIPSRESRALVSGLVRPSSWGKALTGRSDYRAVFKRAVRVARGLPERIRLRRSRAGTDGRWHGGSERTVLIAALDKLRQAGTPVVAVFADGEAALHELESDGVLDQLPRWPNLELHRIAGAAAHTLEPVWMQRSVHRMVDDWLARVLDLERPRAPAGSGPSVRAGGKRPEP